MIIYCKHVSYRSHKITSSHNWSINRYNKFSSFCYEWVVILLQNSHPDLTLLPTNNTSIYRYGYY